MFPFSQGNECVAMDTRQRMNGNQNVHCDGTLMMLTINCHQICKHMRMRLTADKQKSQKQIRSGEINATSKYNNSIISE